MENKELFRRQMSVFKDDTRCRIMLILQYGRYCSNHIEVILNISQPNASRHLDKMLQAKVIKTEKVGRRVIYSVDDEFMKNFPDVIDNLKQVYSGSINLKLLDQRQCSCTILYDL